jgi:hypothetical protein
MKYKLTYFIGDSIDGGDIREYVKEFNSVQEMLYFVVSTVKVYKYDFILPTVEEYED